MASPPRALLSPPRSPLASHAFSPSSRGSNSIDTEIIPPLNGNGGPTESSILMVEKRKRAEEEPFLLTRVKSLHDQNSSDPLTAIETIELDSAKGYGKLELNFFDKLFSHIFGWIWIGSPYSGLACMACSSVCYSIMGLIIKLLSARQIPCFQMLLIRSAIISTLAAPILKKMNLPLFGEVEQRKMIFLRSSIGFVSLAAYFYSIEVLPLRDAVILNFTAPVFTAIFAKIFLNENFSYKDCAGSIVSLLGVIMVTQPSLFILDRSALKPDSLKPGAGSNVFDVSIALLAASAGAVAFCIVRVVGKAGEHPLIIVFCFAFFSFPSSFFCLIIFQKPVVPTFFEVGGMICVGLFAFIAQIFFTRSLQLEKAGRAMTMQYVKVFFTYFLGVFFLHEIPTFVGFLGAMLIVSSSLFIALGRLDQ